MSARICEDMEHENSRWLLEDIAAAGSLPLGEARALAALDVADLSRLMPPVVS